MNYNSDYCCLQCRTSINNRVFIYSSENFGYPLCIDCQEWFKEILENTTTTEEATNLYFALRVRGVPAKLEKFDGYKTIDIAIPQAKVNIEVDGMHHSFDSRQAISDLRRTLHSFKKGYYTLHIPNSLAKYNLDEAADLITEFLNISASKHTW